MINKKIKKLIKDIKKSLGFDDNGVVLDKLSNAKKYYSIHRNMEKAFKFLEKTDLENIPDGKYIIDGDNVFANVQTGMTKAPETTPWELHQTYTDVQYVIKGEEVMGYADEEDFEVTEPYNKEKDIAFGTVKNAPAVVVPEGHFVIFTNEDAHRPMLKYGESKEVKKVIVKVKKPWLRDFLETLFFVIIMLILIRFFIGEVRWIPSASMQPTLLEEDKVFVERYSRFYKTPDRGDILVFYPPQEHLKNDIGSVIPRLTGFFCKDVAYIKRVIGLPGDRINIKTDNTGSTYVYVNGEKLNEPYVKDVKDEQYRCNADTKYCKDFVVPEDSYFMMGDNRGNSLDSRYWGFLKRDRIIGHAIFRFNLLSRKRALNKIQY